MRILVRTVAFVPIIVAVFIVLCAFAQDTDPPNIQMVSHFPITTFEGVEVLVEADIIDASGVQLVRIAYEEDGVRRVQEMSRETGYRYQWTYLNSDIGQRNQLVVTVLNITAVDIHSNWATQVYVNTTITVMKEDIEGPIIEPEAIHLYTESEDHVIIRALVDDPSGVASVKLYYEKEGVWTERSMVYNAANELYEAIIGPFDTDIAVRYYLNATDSSKNNNRASTLETEGGDMYSFVACHRMRYEGSVDDSNYLQVPELHRYKMTKSKETIVYQGYRFDLELSDSGLLTGAVSRNVSGTLVRLQEISLNEKSNAIVNDKQTRDGMAYDFNLKYLSFSASEHSAEIEINPSQRLVFEGYTLHTYITKVSSGEYTFRGKDGGTWKVSMTATMGYDSVTKTFTARNQFLQLYPGGRRDIQVMYLGEEIVPGELVRYRARLRIYKFQEPIFDVQSDIPTGSPPGLLPGQMIYNVYAGDALTQKVIAKNLAGSRAYDISITVTNLTGHGLVVEQGELTSSLGPVYREKQVGNKTVRYYLTYGTLTRSFNLTFPTKVDVRESASFDVMLTYKDAHGDFHQVRIPVQFFVYQGNSNLVVTKTLSRDPLFIGYPATAYIEIQNTGGSPALNVTVMDNAPPNLITDFDTWRGQEIKPGASNKVRLSYGLKATTITKPGKTSYGFVTVDWKGVCYKEGVRNDAYTISTDNFYFTALGPHLTYTQFSADRPIVDQGGQQTIYINVGERVAITATVKNDGNKIGRNMSLSFPGFAVESTTFPTGTDVDVNEYVTFSTTVRAIKEGTYPFQALITHYDELPSLGNVYKAYSNYVLAEAYRSPVMVQFIDPPKQIAAGEVETLSLVIRNIGNSPVENARVLLSLTPGLEMVSGTYLIWEGRLAANENIPKFIQLKGVGFGPNKIKATASGRDIPDVDYEVPILVLSPNVVMERTISCEYLLSRPDYWPRSSEIVSWVTLTLRNAGNDRAVSVVVFETLPNGLLSFDNLTFGSNLIIWGEAGEISLDPNQTITLTYPVWSRTPGHYVYGQARATYTNPRYNSYESKSSTLDVWVLSNRPFLVEEGPVDVFDKAGQPLSGSVAYNDTVKLKIKIRNLGNGKATELNLGEWQEGRVSQIDCIVTNVDQIAQTLATGLDPDALLEVPVELLLLEDVPTTMLFGLVFPLTYRDLEGRTFVQAFSTKIPVRPTKPGLSFSKYFVRKRVAPGEEPELMIRVTNTGDTDLANLRLLVDVPGGLFLRQVPVLGVLRESETSTITVKFDPVSLAEGQVYKSFVGFSAAIEYRTFRGTTQTPEDGQHLELSVAKPYVEVRRSITSQTLLARSDEWPFSSMILENVTITLTNTAEVPANKLLVKETIPDGLHTLVSLGTSQIIWGADGKLSLKKGESISFTYPVWSFKEGPSVFEATVVSYTDAEGHSFESYSQGVDGVSTVAARPYVIWEGGLVQEPAGSRTYNDTVSLLMSVRNIGNGRCTGFSLPGWFSRNGPTDWVLLNEEELNRTLATSLHTGSTVTFVARLGILKDVSKPETMGLVIDLIYHDDAGRSYSIGREANVLLRPAKISVSLDIYNEHYRLMPGEMGFWNVTITNTGDTDLANVTLQAQCPASVSVAAAGRLPVLREGSSEDLSISFNGIVLGDSIGRVIDRINLSIVYTDFRGQVHTKSLGGVNLTVVRPKLTAREIIAKSNTRLGKKYQIQILLANEGTSAARNVRILLPDLDQWINDLKVEGGAFEGNEIILAQDIGPLEEYRILISGRVGVKGRATLAPTGAYADGLGSGYELICDTIQVRSGGKIATMILPFLLWGGVAAAIAGVYYYETRIAEKVKGHQLGSLANSVITHVDATQTVPPLIPYRKKKLSLAEFSYLLSLYLSRAKATSVAKADRTTFIIAHPQSRLVPGQDFRNLSVVKDAYMLLAEMIQNRVKTSQVVPPTFLVQGFKFGISDVVYLFALAVSKTRTEGDLPRSIRMPCSTRISAIETEKKEEGAGGQAEGGKEKAVDGTRGEAKAPPPSNKPIQNEGS